MREHLETDKEFEEEFMKLQIELVKLQKWMIRKRKRLIILFEGRDTAGKGGAIYWFSRFLNPRHFRIVALPKPTKLEKGQWYFQRYAAHLPNAGEMVFFDRSWYNRAVVEPVMDFCTTQQYDLFMKQVVQFEHMLVEARTTIIKFWFSIDIEVQKKRLQNRVSNPLKTWKLSTVDIEAQRKWHEFTRYKEIMFEKTHRDSSPWVIINGNHKPKARMEAIRYVISLFEYDDKDKSINFKCDPNWLAIYDGNPNPFTLPGQISDGDDDL
ncbi:MAG: polyphosphate kinase 2 [Flavobacteriales bacterium]